MSSTADREIGTVLATLLYRPDEIDQLREAFSPAEFVHVHPGDSAAITAALERADVALIPVDLDDRFIEAPRLRWVHCDHAGLERSARPEVFEKGLLVTGSAGRSAEALAQHAFYLSLALTFDARRLFQMQDARTWRGIHGYQERTALWGKTLGIVGFGHTGRAMAALGKAFGMRVIVCRRSRPDSSPDHVDRMFSTEAGDSVDPLLRESDVVMIAALLTDETHHLFDDRAFTLMKDDAYLVNMARGEIVDQDALVHALRSGRIAGAGLDVTHPEPLPVESPLWSLPNVVITPHMTPKLPDRTQRSIGMIMENLERFRAGEPMLNLLTARDVFTRI